jgi:hypothetical protein
VVVVVVVQLFLFLIVIQSDFQMSYIYIYSLLPIINRLLGGEKETILIFFKNKKNKKD